jgi:predicted ATPase with chaperone activity
MEALETSMIQSVAGLLGSDGIQSTRPFREPHHTASMAALVGGDKGACKMSLQVFFDRSGKSLQMRINDRS